MTMPAQRSNGTPPSGTQSICRALDLLVTLAGRQPQMSVSQLAAQMELHPSTVSRLLGALQAYDLVVQDPYTQRFQLGPRCFQLGQVFISQVEVATIAEPFMHTLTAEVGQPSHLGVLRENRVVHLKHVEPDGYVLRMSASERYDLGEVHCEAMGKALLAFQPDEMVHEILDHIEFTRHTANTITTRDGLWQEVNLIRRQGHAVDNGERYENVRCVAVPIWGHDERITAALSISGTDRQIRPRRVCELAERLRDVSAQISRRLGVESPPAPTSDGDTAP